MGVRGLIGRALHPGVSLASDADRITPADAVAALGIVALRRGQKHATVLSAKLGGESRAALQVVVHEATALVFGQRGWEIKGTKKFDPGQIATAFIQQVVTEFVSSPCARCGGHGYRGHSVDSIRHAMDVCSSCGGVGRVAVRLADVTVKVGEKERKVKRITHTRAMTPEEQESWINLTTRNCRGCRGKGLKPISKAVKASKLRPCPSCNGTGRVRASAVARAEALKCHRSHIYRVWGERFKAVLMELKRLEKVGLWTVEEYLA